MSSIVAAVTGAASARRSPSTGGGPPFATLEDPPAMTQNPLIISDVAPQDAGWPTASDMAGRDVKIILPTDRVCTADALFLGTSGNPMRNLWVVGGEFSVTADGGGALTTYNWSGTAFFEGLDIDCNNAQVDGIRWHTTRGRNSRVVVQNSRIRGMGYGTTAHGDILHGQENVNLPTIDEVQELVVQNVRGEAIRQGIFMPYRDGTGGFLAAGVRRIVMDHVELVLDSRFQWDPPLGAIATIYYAAPEVVGSVNKFPPDGSSFNETWLNWWDPHVPTHESRLNATIPIPESYDVNGFAVFSAADIAAGQLVGAWRKGNPPSTFVPLDKIGLNYDRSFFTGGVE